MTKEQEEQSRVAFEKAARDMPAYLFSLQREECGTYSSDWTQIAWIAWQARGEYEATRPTPAQPDRAEVETSWSEKAWAEVERCAPELLAKHSPAMKVACVVYAAALPRQATHPLTPAEREEAVRVMAEAMESVLPGAYFVTCEKAANAALAALEAKGYVGRKE
ncbi:hypothetical protein R5W24_000547 [Gemmata sp. JC717]|uniref:hypothetical protein n=1 Tax=Gemmata algarum TaxID=2975278 RepID=UPI0021BB7BFA|nr:hypothetical protein [Gemmata algarum]MDY3551471.1 hypothetical protein [Gemmata algarum]